MQNNGRHKPGRESAEGEVMNVAQWSPESEKALEEES